VPDVVTFPLLSSPEIDKIAEALAAAQSEMSSAKFDSRNPHLGNKYASLASVIEAVRPALSKHGICFVQPVENRPNAFVAVETRLIHKSGQWLAMVVSAKPNPVNMKRDEVRNATDADRSTPQAIGSAITYLRRYGLQTLVGISADLDDDGGGARLVEEEAGEQDVQIERKRPTAQAEAADSEEKAENVEVVAPRRFGAK
jgi:hypothetical protein